MRGFLEKQKEIRSFARRDKENKWGAVKSEAGDVNRLSEIPSQSFLSPAVPPSLTPSSTTVVTFPRKPLRQSGFHSDSCVSASPRIKDGRVGGFVRKYLHRNTHTLSLNG